jgi:hypothetical protein
VRAFERWLLRKLLGIRKENGPLTTAQILAAKWTVSRTILRPDTGEVFVSPSAGTKGADLIPVGWLR